MTIDLLAMLGNDDLEDELVPFVDIEFDKDFERALAEDTLSFEELMKSAPWQKLEDETDLQYEAFKYFVNLEIDDWDVDSVLKFANFTVAEVNQWSAAFRWNSRRMSYVKSQEWLRRKRKELEHKDGISDFRDTQADLLQTASKMPLFEYEDGSKWQNPNVPTNKETKSGPSEIFLPKKYKKPTLPMQQLPQNVVKMLKNLKKG